MRPSWFIILSVLGSLTACEEEITLSLPEPEERLVVEGYIEQGGWPFLTITRSMSFFSGVDPSDLDQLFVHDAVVKVHDGSEEVTLNEICLNDLPDSLKPLILSALGIDPSQGSPSANFCAYVGFGMTGVIDRSYHLTVELADHYMEATAYIPGPPVVDSIWWEPDQELGDSMVVLYILLVDPDTMGNYYRYFTKANGEPFYPGYFGSVFDDLFINGEELKLAIDKGAPKNSEIDFSTYGLFNKGDTIVTRIGMISESFYDFWRTIEDQGFGGGPFGTPTYIRSNVSGGFGIWGGYGIKYDTLIVSP